MAKAYDYSTHDLTSTRLRLLDELVFVPQQHNGETFYHIELPSKCQFYRIGYPEYVFISLLDGSHTFAQAVTLTARALGVNALTQQHALQVYTWLLENSLAEFVNRAPYTRRNDTSPSGRDAGWLKYFNPFWIKIPLFRPDRILIKLLPACGWLFSVPAMLTCLMLAVAATVVVSLRWERFVASADIIFSPSNWLWMLITWIGLKIIHETAHGITCRRYGGEVREMGLVMILFAPLAYVDVTSSWRFSSKWQRIHVAAAGMYVELMLASIAALIWSQTGSEVTAHLLYNVILMASVSTLLFNANPLMRFDGYYILADLLEVPNLYTEGSRYVRRLSAWVFWGATSPTPQLVSGGRRITKIYGLAATVWRLVICASLLITASVMFEGAGILLGLMGIICWFGKPLWSIAKELLERSRTTRHTVVRAVVVASLIGVSGWAALTWMPWPYSVSAPAVIDYQDMSIVRSSVQGFVERVHVATGQQVNQGDLLLDLRNDELVTEYRELLSQIEQTKTRHRTALDEQNAAGAQVALENLRALQDRLAQKQHAYDALSVRAPVAGVVVQRNLEQLVGSYMARGQELLAVGAEDRKELVVSIDQHDIDQVVDYVGQAVSFRIGARRLQHGVLARVTPRATKEIPHPAMSSAAGGQLAVTQPDAASETPGDIELVEPRFQAVVSLEPDVCREFFCGQQGHVVFGWSRQRAGSQLWRRFHSWLEKRLGEQ